MTVVAVYNMKGGVGKTTTAVTLSHLAAAAGERALLWDLDPQAASSFAFRVRPRVERFGRKSVENGLALLSAIKETDYSHLDLLPADFAYRKFDRVLDELGKPEQVMSDLLHMIGRDYDVVFLDCPPGFSLLTEGIFAAADAVLVPTIPTVLSLRTVARLLKRADRAESSAELAVFFNMVDRRKTLHRRACEWSSQHPELFLTAQVPYASVVEQMSVRRMPLAAFAPRDAATTAFSEVWGEFQTRLTRRRASAPASQPSWDLRLKAVESLMTALESGNGAEDSSHGPAQDTTSPTRGLYEVKRLGDSCVVHSFDTNNRDLHRRRISLELREHTGNFLVVLEVGDKDRGDGTNKRAQVRIDASWARDILAGVMSPLFALERRLDTLGLGLLEQVRTIADGQTLQRVESRATPTGAEGRDRLLAIGSDSSSTIRQAV